MTEYEDGMVARARARARARIEAKRARENPEQVWRQYVEATFRMVLRRRHRNAVNQRDHGEQAKAA